MPLNIFDLENVEMNGNRKSQRMMARIVGRFMGPEYETSAGKLWADIVEDGETLKQMRRVLPGEVKKMEALYGKG